MSSDDYNKLHSDEECRVCGDATLNESIYCAVCNRLLNQVGNAATGGIAREAAVQLANHAVRQVVPSY